MKKFLFILLLLPFMSRAQTRAVPANPGNTIKIKTTPNLPSSPKPAKFASRDSTSVSSTPVNSTPNDGLTPEQRAWLSDWNDYYLETVKVTIHTGNDNKELPSSVQIGLYRFGGEWGDAPASLGQLYHSNELNLNKQELKINSINEYTLQSNFVKPTAKIYNDYNGYRWFALGLRRVQQFGLELHINYGPNFFADAWKVEKVTMTLQFKDILGRPHPSLGTKQIVFNQSKLLNKSNSTLILRANGFLFPQL